MAYTGMADESFPDAKSNHREYYEKPYSLFIMLFSQITLSYTILRSHLNVILVFVQRENRDQRIIIIIIKLTVCNTRWLYIRNVTCLYLRLIINRNGFVCIYIYI